MNNKETIAVIIPAYNEAKVLAYTLRALLRLASAKNIYVIDDGSIDQTYQIALYYTNNVVRIKNHGKANALNFGISHFQLTKKYKYIFFIDAVVSAAAVGGKRGIL